MAKLKTKPEPAQQSEPKFRKCFSFTCTNLVEIDRHGGGSWTCTDCTKSIRKHTLIERLKSKPTSKVSCPKCGAKMVIRKGPVGEFWGCSTFPKCGGSKSK